MWLPAAARILALALLVCLAVLALSNTSFWSGIESRGYDLLIAVRGPRPDPGLVMIVDFDEASVAALNAFPIPRSVLADVISRISSGGPAAVGLDVILDRARDTTSDQRLISALNEAGNVILVSEYGFGGLARSEPLSQFEEAAAGVGFGDLPEDDDGTVRRMYFLLREPGYERVSFAVALASYATEQSLRPGGPSFLYFGSTNVPLISQVPASALIEFRDQMPAGIVPVSRVLSGNFDPQIFKNKIVVIGQSSEMGKDLFTTPVFRFRRPPSGRTILSGAEIQAAAASSLLTGQFPRRLRGFQHWLINLLLVLAGILSLVFFRWWAGTASVLLLMAGMFAVACWMFTAHHLWIPFASTEICLLMSLPAGLGYQYLEEQRLKARSEAERRQLMSLFERYVSSEVAAEIWNRRGEIVLAGEERVATVLFSDIRSFTALTAGQPSSTVLAWLNHYLTAMSEVIKANGGFLNKFIGDGIMVVFGVPLSKGEKDDACWAMRCAQQMLERVEELNTRLEPGAPKLKIGIGIHTGALTAGNVGSPDRLEYSVIGETVNLASRLESLTKDFHSPIVMSSSTWERVHDRFPTRPLGESVVRGFTEKVMLYGLQVGKAAEVSQ